MDNIIIILSSIGGAIVGWIVWEFASINKQHDNLSKDIHLYMNKNDENITDIKVDIGKIQISIEHIEDLLK